MKKKNKKHYYTVIFSINFFQTINRIIRRTNYYFN